MRLPAERFSAETLTSSKNYDQPITMGKTRKTDSQLQESSVSVTILYYPNDFFKCTSESSVSVNATQENRSIQRIQGALGKR